MKVLLLLAVVAATAFALAAAQSQCTADGCPQFVATNISGTGNVSYTNNWTIHKYRANTTGPDQANCLNTTMDADGFWTSTCKWTLNCNVNNGSLVFRNLKVEVVRLGTPVPTIQVTNFSVWNYNILNTPLITLGGLFVPRDAMSMPVYEYNPDSLVTGNSSHDAEISLTISAARPVTADEFYVNVYANFTCSKIYRYVYIPIDDPLSDDGGFWSLFAAYILPSIIVLIIIIIALIRYCNPNLSVALKRWAGFKELDDEGRTRHTKIKDRAGGGTWHDHAAEIVDDLKKDKVDETEARVEDANMSDSEMGEIPPKNPETPKKEQSGDSINLSEDGGPATGSRVAPPKRAKVSDDDLDLDSDKEKSSSESDLELSDDDLL